MPSLLLTALRAVESHGHDAHATDVSRLRAKALPLTDSAFRVSLADTFRSAVAAAGMTCSSLAAKLGLGSGSVVERMANGRGPIQLDKLERVPAVAARFYRARLAIVEAAASTVASPLAALATIGREFGELCAAVTEAGETIDDVEWARIERELSDVEERCAALRRSRRAA